MTTGQALRELGLSAGANQEEVRKAYRTLVTKWHPDKHQNDPIRLRESELRIKRVNKAFEILQTIRFKTDNRTTQKTHGSKRSNTRERSKTDKRHKKSDEKKGPVNSQNKSARPEQKRNRSNKEKNETNPKEDKQDLIFQNKYLILAACAFLLFIGFVAGRFSNSTKSVTPPNLINRTELDRVTKENKELLEEKQKLGGLIKDVEKLSSQKDRLEELLAKKEAQLTALEKTQSESLKISDAEEKKTENLGKDQMKSNLLALQEKATNGKSSTQAADYSVDQPSNTPSEITSLVIAPTRNIGSGGIRRPLFVEVGKNELIIMPNDFDYKKIFGTEEPIKIPVDQVSTADSFKKLMDYVLTHLGKEGILRRRRNTIIVFLIRPEGVDSYRAAKKVVDQYEKTNEKRLIVGILPNGAPVVDSLSGKAPLLVNSEGVATVHPTSPKDLPRNKDGNPLLQQRTVLVSNGKVIPFVDPGKQMETAIANQLKLIIDKNKIDVGEGNYIANESQAMKLIHEFNREPVKDKHFDLKLVRAGRQIRVEIVPKEEYSVGPEKALREIFSNMQGKWYLRYLVEPNSFETYSAMRKITDSSGFYAGWTIIEPNSYLHSLFAGYNIGERPPPRPPRNPGKPHSLKGILD